jgi:hypothetical protein
MRLASMINLAGRKSTVLRATFTCDIGLIPGHRVGSRKETPVHEYRSCDLPQIAAFIVERRLRRVHLHGGSTKTTGSMGATSFLNRLIHIKVRRDPELCNSSNPLFDHILLGEYMVHGEDFGTFGDK